ncbi:MAG: ATPase [Gammaproteobacteria bacterium]|nr:ATPase [Gammaproteobacteria bacterium]
MDVVLTGVESTGKSTLAQALAARLGRPCVPEAARSYLALRGGRYEEGDLLAIARRQWAWARWAEGPAVLDTDLWTLFIWAEVRFGRVDPWLSTAAAAQGPRLYLLCEPDLPWDEDPLREHPAPEARAALHGRYAAILAAQAWPWVSLRGTGPDRLAAAVAALEDRGLLP